MAIVGLPGGLEPRHDQLKELVKKQDRRLRGDRARSRAVLAVARRQPEVQVPLSLIAAVPGRYTGPASRAYLYYTDEHRTWVPGLMATITPKRSAH